MASTFTGLKLQGLLGRFGKTALTDIEGYVELPDGKVCPLLLSHTETDMPVEGLTGWQEHVAMFC